MRISSSERKVLIARGLIKRVPTVTYSGNKARIESLETSINQCLDTPNFTLPTLRRLYEAATRAGLNINAPTFSH